VVWMALFLVLALVVAALVATYVMAHNRLHRQDIAVEEALAGVDVQLTRRADLIPNLVSTVKGYAAHESQTLEAVTQARANAGSIKATPELINDPLAFQKFQEAQAQVASALTRLLAVAEAYPDLKANENFRDLQSQLEGTENRIAVARKRYIDKVAQYNTTVRSFPTNLTAKYVLHMDVKPSLTVPEPNVIAKPPEVKF
jgi:LemA protein